MKRTWGSLLALALALVLAVPPLNGPARAIDLDTACSLTVEPGGSEFAEDIAEAEVVLDLYQIASAKAIPGIDSYTYEFLPDFSGLTIADDLNNDAWMALAQEAAGLALNSESILPAVVGAPAGTEITNLSAGLYLLIARGASLGEDYVTTIQEDDGTETIATVAESIQYTYTFLPELVSLPTKEPDENGVVSTANPGDWIYQAQVTLKPEQSSRLGSLEIVKNLEGYVEGRPATFVFEVEAVLRDEVVYSNVFTISFGEAGTQRLRIDGIPIGATVTVTEVYSGATYQLVTDASQTAVIEAEDIVSVSFVNTPTDEKKNGGSITNEFAYEEGEWQWRQIPDVP